MGKEKKNGKIWIRSIIIAVICSVLTIVLYKAGLLTTLENKTYDTRMLSTSKFIHPDDNIALIVIDQDSLDWANQERGWSWPWPRESAAEIVDYLSLGNPKSICFDMLYTEPSFYGSEQVYLFLFLLLLKVPPAKQNHAFSYQYHGNPSAALCRYALAAIRLSLKL